MTKHETHHGMSKVPLIWSLLDQIILSAFSLILNLVLIRLWAPAVFGVFATLLALSMVFYSIQQALIGGQLAVLRQQAFDSVDEQHLLSSLWMANCVLVGTAVMMTAAGIELIGGDQYPDLAISGALFVGGSLLREYARSLLFSEFNVFAVIETDAIFIASAVAGFGLLWSWGGDFHLAEILFVLAAASSAALLPSIFRRRSAFALQFDGSVPRRYLGIWQNQSRWALLGVISSEIINRAHVFVVGAWFGTAAVGVLQAGDMIFRPLGLMLHAWKRVAQPTFSACVARANLGTMRRLTQLSVLAGIAVSLLYMAAIWLLWPVLEEHVFRGQYANIEIVAALWALTVVLRIITGIYSTQLEGFARFRELSFTSLAGACVALVSLFIVVALGSYQWSILAIAAGLVVDIVLVTLVLHKLMTAAHRQAPAGNDSSAQGSIVFEGNGNVRQRLSGLQPSK